MLKKIRHWHLGTAVLVLVIGITLGRTQMPLKIQVASRDAVPVHGPIKVQFNQDVKAGFETEISPDIAGQWTYGRSPLGVYEAVFTPSEQLQPGYSYSVRITGLKRVISGLAMPDSEQRFDVEVAAGIKSISPEDGDKDVSIRPKLILEKAEDADPNRRLIAKLEPGIKLRQIQNGKTMSWEPVEPLKHGRKYAFEIADEDIPGRKVIASNFTTVSEPKIVKATQGGHFGPGKKVRIEFDQAMPDSNDGIEFGVGGTGDWINDKTYSFTPSGIKPGKTYRYSVKAGMKSKAGGEIQKTRKFKFATNGIVKASFSPGGGVGLNTPVKISFDQKVDQTSAEAAFRVSPSLKGTKSWSGNTMTFSPSGASYQTTYTFSLAAGIKPEWGLPSKAQSHSYITVAQTKKLNVPLFAQQNGRTCEVASLRMALSYRGIGTSESTILGKLGYNPRARNGDNWDNPNQMFVGYANTFSWSQGYGVHAGPIASAAGSYGRSASAHFGVSAGFIAAQVHAGHPVIVWGHISPPRADSWNTSSGRVNTTTSMHARVVYGVHGSKSNPLGFYVHDPWSGGSTGYWSAGGLMANMDAVPGISNQAVVVR